MAATALRVGGQFTWFCHDRTGQIKWWGLLRNGVTTQGVNECLNRPFRGVAQTPWYMGVIDQSGFSAIATADTHSSHPGWTEFTGYGGGARPLWNPAAAISGMMSTSINTSFVITAPGTLRGLFLASSPTQGTASGPTLYCTAITLVADAVPVVATDVLSCSYVLRVNNR